MGQVDDATALITIVLLIILLGGALVDFSGSDDDDMETDTTEDDDTGADVVSMADQPIFDDSRDDDNGAIVGSRDDDIIYGGIAADGIGGQDSDTTFPNDAISAGAGNDTVFGGIGQDVIDGGAGNDTIEAGADEDLVTGGDGNDSVSGGSQDDILSGGAGADTVSGDEGDDELTGGIFTIQGEERGVEDDETPDILTGGEGNDTLYGGVNDTLTGGEGDDAFMVASGVTITDFGTTEGDSDFVDLSPYYTFLEEAQADFAENGALTQVGADPVALVGIEASDLTTDNTGLPENEAPEAVDDVVDLEIAMLSDPVTLPLTANDSDPEGQEIIITQVNGSDIAPGETIATANGSVQLSMDQQSLDFTANPQAFDETEVGVQASDMFTYTIADTLGETDTATVQVTVTQPFGQFF